MRLITNLLSLLPSHSVFSAIFLIRAQLPLHQFFSHSTFLGNALIPSLSRRTIRDLQAASLAHYREVEGLFEFQSRPVNPTIKGAVRINHEGIA
jgi:hypothetical protein